MKKEIAFFDFDGTITKIQLFHGNYKVAETTSSPLNYLLENVLIGTYTWGHPFGLHVAG